MKQNKLKNKSSTLVIFIVAGIGVIFGIILGMMIQQMLFTASLVEFAMNLEGVTFNTEVDINETIIMDRIEEIVKELNTTIQNDA